MTERRRGTSTRSSSTGSAKATSRRPRSSCGVTRPRSGWRCAAGLRLRNPALRRVFDSMDICQSVLASFFARAAVGDFDLEEPPQLIRLLVGMAANKVAEQARHHQRQRRDVRRVGDLDSGQAPAPHRQADPQPAGVGPRAAPEVPRAALRGGAADRRSQSARVRLGGRRRRARRHARGPSQATGAGRRSRRGGARPRPVWIEPIHRQYCIRPSGRRTDGNDRTANADTCRCPPTLAGELIGRTSDDRIRQRPALPSDPRRTARAGRPIDVRRVWSNCSVRRPGRSLASRRADSRRGLSGPAPDLSPAAARPPSS